MLNNNCEAGWWSKGEIQFLPIPWLKQKNIRGPGSSGGVFKSANYLKVKLGGGWEEIKVWDGCLHREKSQLAADYGIRTSSEVRLGEARCITKHCVKDMTVASGTLP